MSKRKINMVQKRTTLILSNKYKLDIHTNGATLYATYYKEKKHTRTLGYFNNIKHALGFIVKHEMKDHDKDRIIFDDYIKRLNEVRDELVEIIDRLNADYEKLLLEELK